VRLFNTTEVAVNGSVLDGATGSWYSVADIPTLPVCDLKKEIEQVYLQKLIFFKVILKKRKIKSNPYAESISVKTPR